MAEIRSSICVLDCPDACSLDVEVREGGLVSIDGGAGNPLTDGYICGKVRSQMLEHVYGEARIRRPMRRTGAKGTGEFEPVSWDEALTTIAERFSAVGDQYGGEAFYRVQLTPVFSVTPGGQLIVNPSRNPNDNVIGIFGIRGRFTF